MGAEGIGQDLHGRVLFLVDVPSWREWPGDLCLPSPNFSLLTVGDATEEDDRADLQAFARAALRAGCVYACAWGPGCEHVHLAFDEAALQGDTGDAVVMTTEHPDETLPEALDFLKTTAWPDDRWVTTCRAAVVVVIGNAEWLAEARRHLVETTPKIDG